MNSKLNSNKTHYPVIIIGGGQAGLSVSYYLQKFDIDHLVIEKKSPMNAWQDKRWDSFTLVTPNWQCQLPGHPYDGNDPNGFMKKNEIIDYLKRFEKKVNAPILNNTDAVNVTLRENYYQVKTNQGIFYADQIVIASGSYPVPIIPSMANKIPHEVQQIHSEQYKNPQQLKDGPVLVVGSGQSGAQIAEDLHLAGRKVHLATGDSPRCARFYRGKDVVEWLNEMKYYQMSVNEHPLREGVRDNSNHYVTGRDGGRDIDLRQFALEGMSLYGFFNDYINGEFRFTPNLAENLDRADQSYNNINKKIDEFIEVHNIKAPEGHSYRPLWQPYVETESLALTESMISSIIWCIGFKPDYSWLDIDVFNERGHPVHQRGITKHEGLYFIGLPWLHTWGSARFSGIAKDAQHLCSSIVKTCKIKQKGALNPIL